MQLDFPPQTLEEKWAGWRNYDKAKRKYLTRVTLLFEGRGECFKTQKTWNFPGGAVVKNLPANAGDMGSSPGPGTTCGGATKPMCHNY